MPWQDRSLRATRAGCSIASADLLCTVSVSSHNTKNLVTNSAGRFAHVALDPFWWDSFSVIRERGLLDRVEKLPWAEGKRIC